ncbi:MAG: riboflavin synthase [Rickettsiales bacterium]|nr:riboflavin synthase [Rickettsiales bacterium]|tara:strand:+ start:459 stop:1052 length:594 start_codon:yes stop_codon:yes gene_type:complete
MFTGIIQNLGNVKNYSNGQLEISTVLDLSDCNIGSSICCNGVCLTATEIYSKDDKFIFKVSVGEETQQRTNFSHNTFNKLVNINIEKSLKIGQEISGHFVYGHVDRTTRITNINKLKNSWEFYFENFKDEDKKFIVEKGSITINGISLTIAKEDNNNFSISVIPHTFKNTNLQFLKIKDLVNVEFDYLARFSMKDKS